MNEGNSERKKANDYHKKKAIAKKNREVYIFNGIRKVMGLLSSDMIDAYIERFPYEKAEKIAKSVLIRMGMNKWSRKFQFCLGDMNLAYFYTICRCAYCGYDHTECYFKRMIRVVSVWSYYLADEVRDICIENNLRPVYIDGDNVWGV